MKQGKFLMGNSVLSRLWNQYPDNMDACSAPERDFLPQMDDYFAGNLLRGIVICSGAALSVLQVR